MSSQKPTLYTCLSPVLLNLYDVNNTVVVIIDVLRATSTIATVLYNGAKSVIPVDNVPRCIELGTQLGAITAGERDGKIAEGLQYGNSPFEYPKEFVEGKTLVITTTNGTRLLHMALDNGADNIITGTFPNISAVCDYLLTQNKNVLLGCAAWKDRVNIEDMLFAGAVANRIKNNFSVECDSTAIAESLYLDAKNNLFDFLKNKNASHFKRLSNHGLDKDIQYCLSADVANVLPVYNDGKLIVE